MARLVELYVFQTNETYDRLESLILGIKQKPKYGTRVKVHNIRRFFKKIPEEFRIKVRKHPKVSGVVKIVGNQLWAGGPEDLLRRTLEREKIPYSRRRVNIPLEKSFERNPEPVDPPENGWEFRHYPYEPLGNRNNYPDFNPGKISSESQKEAFNKTKDN